mmetsp:Transcript_47803/g.104060  ORF Transcript_47803/g.104060 Transcript_47803/m.104060 type:complete len:112 (+) Transcript_47803:849-1184(+)
MCPNVGTSSSPATAPLAGRAHVIHDCSEGCRRAKALDIYFCTAKRTPGGLPGRSQKTEAAEYMLTCSSRAWIREDLTAYRALQGVQAGYILNCLLVDGRRKDVTRDSGEFL